MKVQVMQLFVLVLLSSTPWIVHGTLKVSECPCDGTEYFVEVSYITNHPCGRWSMCAYDMQFYMTHMPGVVLPDGVPSVADYEVVIETIIPEYGYPIDKSLEPWLDKCRKGYRDCGGNKTVLMKSECERLRPQTVGDEWAVVQESGPWKGNKFYPAEATDQYPILEGEDFHYNWFRLWADGEDGSMPVFKPRFFPLDKRFFWGACPSWLIRPTYTMSVLLSRFAGVEFTEDSSIPTLLAYVPQHVIRAMYCAIFTMSFDTFYLKYNHSQFCHDFINGTYTYACLVMNHRPEDSDKRDPVEDCNAHILPNNHEVLVDYTDELIEKGDKELIPILSYQKKVDEDYEQVEWKPNHWGFGLPWSFFPDYETPPKP